MSHITGVMYQHTSNRKERQEPSKDMLSRDDFLYPLTGEDVSITEFMLSLENHTNLSDRMLLVSQNGKLWSSIAGRGKVHLCNRFVPNYCMQIV